MANCPQKSISSDTTTLAYSIEKCLNEAEANPVWKPLEPNSVDNYGATITTATRNPIGTGRQRVKGEITDLEAGVGYTSDLTSLNHQDFIKGFLLAESVDLFELRNTSSAKPVQSVTADSLTYQGSASRIVAGDIVMMEGFDLPANNKVRTVATNVGNVLTFTDSDGAVENTAANSVAHVIRVGMQSDAGEWEQSVVGGVYKLEGIGLGTAVANDVKAGDWVYMTGLSYTGFARVKSTDADEIVFDRVMGKYEADTGVGKVGKLFFSMKVRNPDKRSDMVLWSYEFEQQLGEDADGPQARYVRGAMANEFTLTVPSADKVTAQFGFVACDEDVRTGSQGLKSGVRDPLISYPMFNSGNKDNRVWLHVDGDAEPLFVYATNATVTVNNGMTGVKAIGVTGNLDINVGTFEVGGSVTAYFLDVRSIAAMRSNADVGATVSLRSKNTAVIFDMPKTGLSNGQTAIEVGNPVTIAIDMAAVRNDLGYTLQYCFFPYLP